MKVKELKEILNTMPDDMSVVFADYAELKLAIADEDTKQLILTDVSIEDE